jgi:hypothetical protein
VLNASWRLGELGSLSQSTPLACSTVADVHHIDVSEIIEAFASPLHPQITAKLNCAVVGGHRVSSFPIQDSGNSLQDALDHYEHDGAKHDRSGAKSNQPAPCWIISRYAGLLHLLPLLSFRSCCKRPESTIAIDASIQFFGPMKTT